MEQYLPEYQFFNRHNIIIQASVEETYSALWDFSLEELGPRGTQLNTETRISCLDESAYRWFRPYWFFISPFSAWIRKISLELVKQQAEAEG